MTHALVELTTELWAISILFLSLRHQQSATCYFLARIAWASHNGHKTTQQLKIFPGDWGPYWRQFARGTLVQILGTFPLS